MTSVASRNIFDILADVEDQPQETASEPSKEEIVVSKKVDRSRASKTEARIRHEYPQRGGAPRAAASTRGNDEARSGPRDRNVGPRLSGRRNQDDGNGGSDYPPRNARGARAGERSRGGGRGGRRGREYDRHSGTGREESGKKDSQAWGDPTSPWPSESNEPGKWGNDAGAAEQTSWAANDDSANGGGTWGAENEAPGSNEAGGWNEGEDAAKDDNVWNPGNSLDDLSTTDNVDWKSGEKDKEDDGGYSIDAVQAPVEIVQKTLDEYLAERAQRGLGVTLPEPRQPNEGTDDSQWKDAVPLERADEEDVLFAGKETSYKLKSKDKPKKKEYIEIEQAFERTSSGPQRGRGRGRGGREGNRERRDNRDGHRENRRGRSDNVNLDDKRDFPSLGTA